MFYTLSPRGDISVLHSNQSAGSIHARNKDHPLSPDSRVAIIDRLAPSTPPPTEYVRINALTDILPLQHTYVRIYIYIRAHICTSRSRTHSIQEDRHKDR